MRVLALLLLLVSPLRAPQIEVEFAYKIIDFEKHWDKFVRRYFGCLEDQPITVDTCSGTRAYLDRREFNLAREEAKKLFELKDE